MAGGIPTRADDERLLTMLDLRDHDGLTLGQISKRLRVSRGAISGAFHRVDNADLPCACTKPENRDGGIPRRCWAS